jgi:hypothetical protein
MKFVINEKERQYLRVQKGMLSEIEDNRAFDEAYNKLIEENFQEIKPYLPQTCRSILDVGSGLGGINARISEHYEFPPQITLLDGYDDLPVVNRHAETFNDYTVARVFLEKHGCPSVKWEDPVTASDTSRNRQQGSYMYDLVISYGAWCFHTPPEMYLHYVKAYAGGLLILDVRKDKPEWFNTLIKEFKFERIIKVGKKYDRCLFRAKQS